MIEIRCIICDEKIGSMPDYAAGRIKACCCSDPRCEKAFRTVSVE
jgi:hypothetical protein